MASESPFDPLNPLETPGRGQIFSKPFGSQLTGIYMLYNLANNLYSRGQVYSITIPGRMDRREIIRGADLCGPPTTGNNPKFFEKSCFSKECSTVFHGCSYTLQKCYKRKVQKNLGIFERAKAFHLSSNYYLSV
jgi:hypothetical protein